MLKKIHVKPTYLFSNEVFLREREWGFQKNLGFEDHLCKKLMSSLDKCNTYLNEDVGGIFNLEFSLNGSILAAACEKKSIHLYDSLNQRLITHINNAHSNCVNCIRFVDPFAFASASDDNTIKLWDLRFLKEPTRTLRGHSNWVKNIEYCAQTGRLVTSAFDGSIYSWDLNNYTESGVINNRVFTMDGLMRMKLTPDGTKMVICSTSGYILLIHDLNLETLSADLQKFRPNLYRLMQTTEQNLPTATQCNHLFSLTRKRNRVELISDFPNDPEVISSLQIHPMGWCALTRNINGDESSEWTCVHDIQERNEEQFAYRPAQLPLITSPQDQPRHQDQEIPHPSQSPMDLWIGFVTNHNIREQRLRMDSNHRGTGIRTTSTSVVVVNSGILLTADNLQNASNDEETKPEEKDKCKIIQNLSRLTHYIPEPNVGKGFIKELCFSPDGRVMCSPYNTGIRLLAFNSSCNELSTCVPEHAQRLTTIRHYNNYHRDIVVSCKFNPVHCLLVSGCLGGQIIWYQPIF